MNRRITLARRPAGLPQDTDFALVEAPIPDPGEGEVLYRTIYASIDPYMRGRMNEGKSYATPVAIGGLMGGGSVGQVVKSRDPAFAEGDFVEGYGGWQDYAVQEAKVLRKLDPAAAPLSTALGVLGMPGFTGWYGLLEIGKPKPGETVVVAAATGPVGATVAQVARLKGARVVAIAGSEEKLAYLREELGIETVLSHRSPTLAEDLAEACPDGIDVYFENVGGAVLDAVLPLLNLHARVPLCGIIAHYNESAPPPGPNRLPLAMGILLRQRATIAGYIISDHWERFPEFLREATPWVQDGTLKYREDLVEGLEKTPEAFRGLLQGKNFGKLLVRVSDDPTA